MLKKDKTFICTLNFFQFHLHFQANKKQNSLLNFIKYIYVENIIVNFAYLIFFTMMNHYYPIKRFKLPTFLAVKVNCSLNQRHSNLFKRFRYEINLFIIFHIFSSQYRFKKKAVWNNLFYTQLQITVIKNIFKTLGYF